MLLSQCASDNSVEELAAVSRGLFPVAGKSIIEAPTQIGLRWAIIPDPLVLALPALEVRRVALDPDFFPCSRQLVVIPTVSGRVFPWAGPSPSDIIIRRAIGVIGVLRIFTDLAHLAVHLLA